MESALSEGKKMHRKDMEFNEVVEQYTPMIYSIIHKLHIQHNVEQFYQEGLVALWYAWKGYDASKANFSTYAYRTIRGMLLNMIKEDRRYYDAHCVWNPEMDEVMPDVTIRKTIREQVEELESYMTPLTGNQRIWLIEYMVNGKKLDEIATEYGTTVAAVKAWRRGAIKNIKDYVRKELSEA